MTNMLYKNKWIITRRDFLKASVLAGISAASLPGCSQIILPGTKARFGIITDSHYADTDTRNNRYYRESAAKLAECIDLMNQQKVDFLVELGDFKDQDEPPVEEKTISHLRDIEKVFRRFRGPKYHVVGNHDIDSISKKQFLENIINTDIRAGSAYYSFESRGVHFVVLDANYRKDETAYDSGNFTWTDTHIPTLQLEWLRQDLAATSLPAIIFVHQLLDGTGGLYVDNAREVRDVLQASGRVLAVFQGHKHDGDYKIIEGIHYYTLKAVVDGSGAENNSYAVVEVLGDNGITVTGYRKAVSRELSPAV
ncbi:MAG: metallophosphoesterase [Sedimentisphaerales bacterium]|nr:metallophosphoesterase [Sedimentisphaerales bacterium]